MASESEPESGPAEGPKAPASEAPPSAKAAPSDRPKKKKARRPRLPIPRTEEEIDSPTKQTVGMLGILCIMTIIMWAFARGACNYHPPKETRTPRAVTTVDLAHDPKNAAVELQQRWLTNDFDSALELATGDVTTQIQADKAACDAACLAKKSTLAKTVLTTADVLDINPLGATVRVKTIGLPDGAAKTYLMHLSRVETIWKADDRKVDTGAPFVAPTVLPTPDSVAPPAVSGAPVSSGAHGAPATSSSASGSPAVIHIPKPTPAPAASH
jgi:hypothetical protein